MLKLCTLRVQLGAIGMLAMAESSCFHVDLIALLIRKGRKAYSRRGDSVIIDVYYNSASNVFLMKSCVSMCLLMICRHANLGKASVAECVGSKSMA